ncbi:MAG: sensor histidine kinase [Flavobacteriales bacterium]|nr:sensor histidine kinase [Flavobacteriales bacterium]
MFVRSLITVLLISLFSVQGVRGQIVSSKGISKSQNLDTAIADAERFLANVAFRNDSAKVFKAYCFLAEQYTLKSRYPKAEKYIAQAAQIANASGNLVQQAYVLLETANLKKYESKFSEALDAYLQAESILLRENTISELPRFQLEIAEFYRKTAQHAKAKNYLQQAFDNYEKSQLRDTLLLIRMNNRAAAIHNESTPDVRVSIYYSRRALDLAKRIKDRNLMATSENELGFTYKNLRQNDSSEYYYQEAEKNWFAVGNYSDGIHAMNNRAMLYAHNNFSRDSVFRIYFQIIDKVEKDKIDYPLNEVYHYLYLENIWSGDTGKAISYLEKYHSAEMIMERKMNDIDLLNVREKYENEKIKNAYQKVSDELNKSNQDIITHQRENVRLLVFLGGLLIALVIIITLTYKLRSSNKELRAKNKEKDSLIQEIHHRVKNNLQFISSLVNMQMKASENADEIHTLSDASRRINAMALVHEMLYNQDEQQGISVKLYLEELIDSLKDIVQSDSNPIEFITHIKEINFTVQEAISLGMITSEIVANSIKHAFADVDQPQVKILLEELESKKIRYTISDNGNGFNTTTSRKSSLGLRLIDIFSRQLKGAYSIEGNNGFSYTITFNIK